MTHIAVALVLHPFRGGHDHSRKHSGNAEPNRVQVQGCQPGKGWRTVYNLFAKHAFHWSDVLETESRSTIDPPNATYPRLILEIYVHLPAWINRDQEIEK